MVGYIDYTAKGHCYGLMAYEFGGTDFHPALVIPADTSSTDYLWEEHSLYTEICFNVDTLSEKDLYYFDDDESTLYVRSIENTEKNDECSCATGTTDRFLKYVWNGKNIVLNPYSKKNSDSVITYSFYRRGCVETGTLLSPRRDRHPEHGI